MKKKWKKSRKSKDIKGADDYGKSIVYKFERDDLCIDAKRNNEEVKKK